MSNLGHKIAKLKNLMSRVLEMDYKSGFYMLEFNLLIRPAEEKSKFGALDLLYLSPFEQLNAQVKIVYRAILRRHSYGVEGTLRMIE